MRKLRVWLRSRGGDLGEDEILRIWKGLFYCFWMSDKPLVQGSDQIRSTTVLLTANFWVKEFFARITFT